MPEKKEKNRKLICPFHGLVDAVISGDRYTCEIKDCEIYRSEKELE